MKSKYRRPPLRICDQCRRNFYGWSVLCEPCVRELRNADPARETLRQFRKRVIEGK